MSGKQEQNELFNADRMESAVDRVLNVFKETLITGKLKPGDRLPSEVELSRSLSISRGSIREAMKILSAFNIVEIRRGDGTYIAQSDYKVSFDPLLFSLILSNANVKELVELRELMEFAIVKLVIQHATKENLENIAHTISEMEELIGNYEDNEPDQLVRSDLDFHKALGKATNNRLVEKVYHFVMDFFTPSIRLTHENQKGGRNALEHHKRIFEALKRRNVDESIVAVEGSIVAWKELSHVIKKDSTS
ncbi:MAG TPA: FadR family transcriptional regulator [Spirochaetes bacterium]|nr:FadR family transcriptional regulator [Spirochaetota bacterium]